MYELLTIIIFISSPVASYQFWQAVFPLNFRDGKYPFILLLIVNAIAIYMISDDGLVLSEIITAFFKMTIVSLVIGLVVFVYNAIKNSSLAESFRSGHSKGRAAADYQIGGAAKSSKKSASKPLFKKKSKSEPLSAQIEGNNIKQESKAKTTPNQNTVKKKKDSTKRSHCYNCRYWTGNRQLLGGGNFIEYEDIASKCAPGGGRQHVKVEPRATCRSFEPQF